MRRRRYIIALSLCALVIIGWLVFAFPRAREPRYRGRTLTEWIGDTLREPTSNVTNSPAWQKSSEAAKHMAPEAVPWLLKLIQARDSRLKQQVAGLFDYVPIVHIHITRAYETVKIAEQGFALLGEDAKPAWPELIRLTESPDVNIRAHAFECLCESRIDKQALMPVLIRFLRDPYPSLQHYAAIYFVVRCPQEAEAAGVYKKFPWLKDAGK